MPDNSTMRSLFGETRPVIVTLFLKFYQENATFTSNLFIQYYNANPEAAAALVSFMAQSNDSRIVQILMGFLNALNEIDRNAVTNLLLLLGHRG